MLAPSEGHVSCCIRSAENELIGTVKDLRIAICSCIAQRHWLPWLDDLTVYVHIFAGRTCEASIGAVQSQELLHRRRDKGLVFPESRLQLFVFRKMKAYGSDQNWRRHDTHDQRLPETPAVGSQHL